MDKYNVTGMSCSACSSRVEKAVSKVDGVTLCQVNLLTNSMMVDGTASSQEIIDAVQTADTVLARHLPGMEKPALIQQRSQKRMRLTKHLRI